jgi:hypothetical protein
MQHIFLKYYSSTELVTDLALVYGSAWGRMTALGLAKESEFESALVKDWEFRMALARGLGSVREKASC